MIFEIIILHEILLDTIEHLTQFLDSVAAEWSFYAIEFCIKNTDNAGLNRWLDWNIKSKLHNVTLN